VETRLITFRTRDALHAVSQIRKSESITGLRRQLREKDKEMEDRPTSRKLSEEPKTDSDIILLLRPNQENKTETKYVQRMTVLFLIIFSIFFWIKMIYNGQRLT
jgi:hypothetical protein